MLCCSQDEETKYSVWNDFHCINYISFTKFSQFFFFFNSSLSKETFSRMNGSVQFLSYKFSFSEEKCFKQMAVIVILNYEKKKCQCWNIFNKINCLNLAYVSCAFLQILIIENTVKANTLVRHFKIFRVISLVEHFVSL